MITYGTDTRRFTRPVYLPVFIVDKMQYACQLIKAYACVTVSTDGAKLYATCTGRPIDIKLIDYGVPSGVCDLTVPPDRIEMGSCTNRNDLKNTYMT